MHCGSVALVLLLIASLACGQLFVSPSGNSSSSVCSGQDPCASIYQAVRVFEEESLWDGMNLILAPGSYNGTLNTNITLPEGAHTISSSDDASGSVLLEGSSQGEALFVLSSCDLNLIGVELNAPENYLAMAHANGVLNVRITVENSTVKAISPETFVAQSDESSSEVQLFLKHC